MDRNYIASELVKAAKEMTAAPTPRDVIRASSSGSMNERYLNSISPRDKAKILTIMANHYGISIREMEGEIIDADAEALYEYLSFNNSMAMKIYRDFKNMRLAGCEKLPAGRMRDNCEKKEQRWRF